MRTRIVLALLLLGAAVSPVAAFPATSRQAGADRSLASAVLAQLNAARLARGLVPLRAAPGLRAAADLHSREMARNGYFDHRSADGSPFWKRVERYYPAGGADTWAIGENLLWSSPGLEAAEAIRMWMRSPEHRRNLLDPRWREIGISALHVPAAQGVYDGLEVTLVTADFGVRRSPR